MSVDWKWGHGQVLHAWLCPPWSMCGPNKVSVGCVVMEKLNISQKRETVNTVRNATFITDKTIIGILLYWISKSNKNHKRCTESPKKKHVCQV
jgi:hypothetical protein